MNLKTTAIAVAIVPVLGLACVSGSDGRCGSDFVYEDGTCWPVVPDAAAAEEDAERAEVEALAEDEGTLPDGLGRPCTARGNECDGLTASYCAMQPGQDTGYCTVEDCAVQPDSCPTGYRCCDFPDALPVPNWCAVAADYDAMGGMCLGG